MAPHPRIFGKWLLKHLAPRHFSQFPEDVLSQIGCELKTYQVETDDGYILQLHRIVKSKKVKELTDGSPVVLLQHGMWGTSRNWLVQRANDSICLKLLKKGCDIWLGNSRGNNYSRKHNTLNISDKKFWDFSFHEMGVYDLPATINFIINETKTKSLHYVGHSQGTTIVFVLLATKPEYNAKISSITALAPVVYLRNVQTALLKPFSSFANVMGIADNLGCYRLGLPQGLQESEIDSLMALDKSYFIKAVTPLISYSISKFAPDYVKQNMSRLVLGHLHAGVSTKQLAHYGQLINHGRFCQFDLGIPQNVQKYGSALPLNYDLSQISCPTNLLFSEGDWLTNIKDIEILREELPNVRCCKLMPLKTFNHMDYLWSGVGTRFIIKEMNSYII